MSINIFFIRYSDNQLVVSCGLANPYDELILLDLFSYNRETLGSWDVKTLRR
mgnify:CR=1 FL=1